MLALLQATLGAVLAAFRPRASLVIENLALRQQLAILRRAEPRPRLRPFDRAFWVVLARTWSRWADALAIVKPATVLAWHRRGFAWFWAKKSTPIGRPSLAEEIVALIVRMARENPTCENPKRTPRAFPLRSCAMGMDTFGLWTSTTRATWPRYCPIANK